MKDQQQPAKSAPKVLVVDDNEGMRALLARDLTDRGYQVITAADGLEAIPKARGQDVDVVVTDLSMPNCDGLETLRALKALDPRNEVILMTGFAAPDNAVQCMKLGAYDFITKPFQVGDLARMIARAVEKRRLGARVAELQDINRFKSEFLATMSHELRTPMNVILGFTELHLERVYGEITPKQEKSLKSVETAGKNLLRIINGILDHSKLSAGRMPVYLEDFSVKELSKEVLELMEGLAHAKHLKLEWGMTDDLRLRSDKTKIKQILINLIANGIKFTSKGGVFIELHRATDSSLIHIAVRDTGIGIKAADLPLLFREFKQLDSSSTREQGGTGLGLVISRQFAELLGGTIKVESAVGAGTTFTVTLPLVSLDAKDSIAEILNHAPAAGGRGGALLAIDDDPDILNLLRDSLDGSGFGFVGALTGEEGIALARRIKPMAITLDVMMPRRDGWAVLQILKNDPELRSIPVIMVSLMDNKSLGFALGVTAYVVKPFNRAQILEKLKAIAGGLPSSETGRSEIAMDPFCGK